MRRSQRLIERKPFAYNNALLNDATTLLSDNVNADINIEIKNGCTYNASVPNDDVLPLVPTVGNAISTNEQFSDFKNQDEESKNSSIMDNKKSNATQTNNSKLKQPPRKRRSTITARSLKNKRTSQAKTNQQCKGKRLAAVTKNMKMEAPIISIDNYLNPLRHPLLQAETNTQLIENNDFKCYNNIPKLNLKSNNDSLLPQIYPKHFINQNFTNTLINPPPQILSVPMTDTNFQPKNHFPTPELTQSLDFESSTSTLSLPESLREVFGCEDIREVLKMDKILFRMRILHLQTLAFVLNIQYEYLYALVEKIMQLDTETLQKVVYAFKPVVDIINCQTGNKDE